MPPQYRKNHDQSSLTPLIDQSSLTPLIVPQYRKNHDQSSLTPLMQSIEIVTVFIAAGNGEHPRPDHVGVSVGGARRVARVGHAGGEQVGNPEPSLDAGKQQNATVRRQPSAIEPGAQFLARNG
jgi:hypothetical protein